MSEMSYDDLLTVRNSLIGILKKIDKEVQIDEDDTALEILDLIGENFGGEGGYVEDVELGGSSIVTDGVASIPKAQNIAKSGMTAPITATDPKWSDEDMITACQRMGAIPKPQWNLVFSEEIENESEGEVVIDLGEGYDNWFLLLKFYSGSELKDYGVIEVTANGSELSMLELGAATFNADNYTFATHRKGLGDRTITKNQSSAGEQTIRTKTFNVKNLYEYGINFYDNRKFSKFRIRSYIGKVGVKVYAFNE